MPTAATKNSSPSGACRFFFFLASAAFFAAVPLAPAGLAATPFCTSASGFAGRRRDARGRRTAAVGHIVLRGGIKDAIDAADEFRSGRAPRHADLRRDDRHERRLRQIAQALPRPRRSDRPTSF